MSRARTAQRELRRLLEKFDAGDVVLARGGGLRGECRIERRSGQLLNDVVTV